MVAPNGEEYFKDINELASFIGVHSNPIEFKEMFCKSVRSITEEDFTIVDLDRFITKRDYKIGASMLSLANAMVEINLRRVTQGKATLS